MYGLRQILDITVPDPDFKSSVFHFHMYGVYTARAFLPLTSTPPPKGSTNHRQLTTQKSLVTRLLLYHLND